MNRKKTEFPGRRVIRLAAAFLIVATGVVVPFSTGAAPASAEPKGSLEEVAQFPLLSTGANGESYSPDRSGWLILDTRNRFAYQVFERLGGRQGGETLIQSFDLDSLRPIRQDILDGVPVSSGIADVVVPGGAGGGEIVHAVDEETGRLYLAMAEASIASIPRQLSAASATDGQRPLHRFVMIDGKAFNSRTEDYGISFREPINHAPLHNFYVLNLAVTQKDRLLVTFAHPATTEVNKQPTTPLYGHTLARWNVAGLIPVAPTAPTSPRTATESTSIPLVDAGEERALTDCARSTMGAQEGAGEGQLQWGTLVGRNADGTPRALYVACQLSPGNGTVVELPLGPGGSLRDPRPTRVFPLAKQVTDVLVDEVGQRLLLRVLDNGAGNTGTTLWVFDAAKARYTGAVAVKQSSGFQNSFGLDQATGRVYALVPDHASGGVPIRGGLQITDARLDPAPPLENVRPDLAYSGVFRIMVDPPTRRVFVRRGQGTDRSRVVYPCISLCAPAPTERFYRVFEDRIPVPELQPDVDDSLFTTNVAEGPLTRASYLGTGTGFGSRALLVGGLDAPTSQGVTASGSACGKDDRELLAGSVGQVNLSDLSTAAEAASLDADARTQRLSPDLVNACKRAGVPAGPDTEQVAFDESTGKDADGDGRIDRTGVNHYAASCLGDPDKAVTGEPPGFKSSKTGRDAFKAQAVCDQPAGTAKGKATAAGAVVPFDTLQDSLSGQSASFPADRLRVAHSSSTVDVVRKEGEGITVTVDSVARGIEIPTVGSIAVVRTEATSKADGRAGGAEGTFVRTICGVVLAGRATQPGCTDDPKQQQQIVEALNTALGARGRARLRSPDPVLMKGSGSGYRASVQRHRDDVFEDRSVTKDSSLAVTGLELMFFQGDGDARWGTGRQILQLAAAQASASYGITCLYGQLGNGRCAKEGEATGGGSTVTVSGPGSTETIVEPGSSSTSVVERVRTEPRWKTIALAPVRALQQALRLLFNNPRELGLMAAVWALLYAPCYLGERRRSIRGLRAGRAAVGAGGAA